MTALLDINVLLALLDSAHVHHGRAKNWILSQPTPSWASCPITQNGFVRIISQPSYPNHVSVAEAIALLRHAANGPFHEFWPDNVSILNGSTIDSAKIHGPKQVTDLYLLALAVSKGGRLVALDRSIPLSAVPGARPDHLVLL